MDTKLNEAVASLLKDKSKRQALAELITEVIPQNHIGVDYIGMLLRTRALKPGDSLVKRIRKGTKVFTFVTAW